MSEKDRIDALERQVVALRNTLHTFIAWTASSANSPIRADEAKTLVEAIRVND